MSNHKVAHVGLPFLVNSGFKTLAIAHCPSTCLEAPAPSSPYCNNTALRPSQVPVQLAGTNVGRSSHSDVTRCQSIFGEFPSDELRSLLSSCPGSSGSFDNFLLNLFSRLVELCLKISGPSAITTNLLRTPRRFRTPSLSLPPLSETPPPPLCLFKKNERKLLV